MRGFDELRHVLLQGRQAGSATIDSSDRIVLRAVLIVHERASWCVVAEGDRKLPAAAFSAVTARSDIPGLANGSADDIAPAALEAPPAARMKREGGSKKGTTASTDSTTPRFFIRSTMAQLETCGRDDRTLGTNVLSLRHSRASLKSNLRLLAASRQRANNAKSMLPLLSPRLVVLSSVSSDARRTALGDERREARVMRGRGLREDALVIADRARPRFRGRRLLLGRGNRLHSLREKKSP